LHVSDEDLEDTHVRDGESIKTEIQIAESLIENCEPVIQSIKTKMTSSLSHEEIEELTAEGKASSSFLAVVKKSKPEQAEYDYRLKRTSN
jgi:hypothetical protein